MENSKPINGLKGLQTCRDGMARISSDIILRDNKGRLISRGTHRDLKSVR